MHTPSNLLAELIAEAQLNTSQAIQKPADIKHYLDTLNLDCNAAVVKRTVAVATYYQHLSQNVPKKSIAKKVSNDLGVSLATVSQCHKIYHSQPWRLALLLVGGMRLAREKAISEATYPKIIKRIEECSETVSIESAVAEELKRLRPTTQKKAPTTKPTVDEVTRLKAQIQSLQHEIKSREQFFFKTLLELRQSSDVQLRQKLLAEILKRDEAPLKRKAAA